MPNIAREVLIHRLEESGWLEELIRDAARLCSIELHWNTQERENDPDAVPLNVGAVRVGSLIIPSHLPPAHHQAIKRWLTLSLEAIGQRLAHQHRNPQAVPAVVVATARYIRSHHVENISLKKVAHEMGLSCERLSRLFHVHMGITFSEYLNGSRLEGCKRMLLESDDSIADIAFACGYQSISQFNRRFKSCEGMSPRDYRQKAHQSPRTP